MKNRVDKRSRADREREDEADSSTPSSSKLPTPSTLPSVSSDDRPLSAPASHHSSLSSSSSSSSSRAKIIVVLVKAALWTVRTKSGYELASSDSHASLLGKLKKDPAECRPDIVHHCLLTLLDSPLNKAGLLQIYVQTEDGQLIDVHPSCRIPRTYKRFAGLMVQLLHKLKIRSNDSSQYLLRVIRNPVTDHLPANSLKIGTSVKGTLININELAKSIGGNTPKGEGLKQPIVFCVGSHAVGAAEVDWTEKTISVSQYPLSAAVALGRICNAFESAWDIL